MNTEHQDAVRMITLLSLSHTAVDFLCVFSLFRSFSDMRDVFFLYNFCAFALQMPLGVILDIIDQNRREKGKAALAFVFAGMLLTVCGSFLSPVIAGIGNAFFHTGGGVLTIHEDRNAGMKGKGLGVFVAPGTFGVTFGILFRSTVYGTAVLFGGALFLMAAAILLLRFRNDICPAEKTDRFAAAEKLLAAAGCFLAVILRSLGGMAIAFEWKQGALMSIAAAVCIACGKAAGGFLGAGSGLRRTFVFSLLSAAVCFALGKSAAGGLAALLFFNMTMPLTLYILSEVLPDLPGFGFGLLTFGLFLGYLPVLYGVFRDVPPFPAGTVISLLSLAVMLLVLRGACRE